MKLLTAVLVLLTASYGPGQSASSDDCTRTAHMQVYSNATFIEEAGDVVGYDLALNPGRDSTTDALLYVYEGAPNMDGIRLTGRVTGKRLVLEGKWIENLVEYPSKKELVQTHFVRIAGTVDSAAFRGTMSIEGLVTPAAIRLKHVDHIWLCRQKPPR